MTIRDVINNATALGACGKTAHINNWQELAHLFFTPQGLEFCQKNNFPSIDICRAIKTDILSHNVFVDCGNINIENQKNVCVAGNTYATIKCSENSFVHKIIMMHGAKAKIYASNYAVIRIVKLGEGDVDIQKDNTVVIL